MKVLAVGASAGCAAGDARRATSTDGATPPPTNSGVLTFEVTQDQAPADHHANRAAARSTWCCCRPTSRRRLPERPRPRRAASSAVESYATVGAAPSRRRRASMSPSSSPTRTCARGLRSSWRAPRSSRPMEDLVQQLSPARPVVAVFGPGFASPIGFQHVHRRHEHARAARAWSSRSTSCRPTCSSRRCAPAPVTRS